jgi:hypothetical protein
MSSKHPTPRDHSSAYASSLSGLCRGHMSLQQKATRWRVAPLSFRRHTASLRVHRQSATGTRTRVARARAEYPNQPDYSGACNPASSASSPGHVAHKIWFRRERPTCLPTACVCVCVCVSVYVCVCVTMCVTIYVTECVCVCHALKVCVCVCVCLSACVCETTVGRNKR